MNILMSIGIVSWTLGSIFYAIAGFNKLIYRHKTDNKVYRAFNFERKDKSMVQKHTWEQFYETGLLLTVNQILHIFGWSIVFELENTAAGEVKSVYPARVKFRGFSESNVVENYIKVSKYVAVMGEELLKESQE